MIACPMNHESIYFNMNFMDFCPEIEEGKHINLPTLHGWNSQHTFLAPSWRMTNMHELITPTQQGRILARLQPYKLC